MRTSDNGLDHIKKFEGYKPTSYNDVGGLPTIGYGHLIDITLEAYLLNSVITETKALELLAEDVADAERAVNTYVMATLKQHEFDALVSLVYNIGSGNFSSSTVLKRINLREPEAAIVEAWQWFNKVGPNVVQGLVNRRKSEVELYTGAHFSVICRK